eukprot:1086035-Pyramimonas_sp.AAC.2
MSSVFDDVEPSSRTALPEWTVDAKVVEPPPTPPKEKPDVNETLVLNASDWGVNPPVKGDPYVPPRPPFKPAPHQLTATLGNVVVSPRDRPFAVATGRKKAGDFSPTKSSLSPTKKGSFANAPPSPRYLESPKKV